MARLSRLALPGYPHHVLQRGNNRERIFADDTDRATYLRMLRDSARARGVAVHAWVMMDNHVHLLATPPDGEALSRMMQGLGRSYVGWFNQRHGRSGTLWEGRFRSSPVEPAHYLIACMRYIEQNPLRSVLVAEAGDYAWSSARHHLGLAVDALVTDHPAFWALGNTPFEREARYRALLAESLAGAELETMREALMRERVLGTPGFLDRLAQETGRRTRPGKRGRPRQINTVPN